MIGWLRSLLGPPPQVQSMQVLRRSYEAASTGRSHYGWGTGGLGPTTANLQASQTLRDRSRDAYRNQPLAVRGMTLLVGRMLGEAGMQPRFSSLGDPGLSAAARELWRDWSELCDNTGTLGLVGVQAQMLHALYCDGGGLLRFWFLADEPGGVPLTLQPLELDYLDTITIGTSMLGGIEVNERGRVVAYHLRREHPGESLWMRGTGITDRIPAREIAHLHMAPRPGALLGVPVAHAALSPMRYLDDLGDADLVRLRAQATLAAIVQGASAPSPTGSGETPGGFGTVMRDADGNVVETLTPGSIHYTDAESVTLTSPRSDASLPATVAQWHHLIAVAMGVQYHDLVGDLTAVNYSSYRAGHITDRQNTLVQRGAYIYPRLLVPLWRAWREAVQAVDGSMRALPRRMEWTPPQWHSVDPAKDAAADITRIQAGLDSLSRAIEKSGMDPDEVWASLAADRTKLAELSLSVSSMLTPPEGSDIAPNEEGPAQ